MTYSLIGHGTFGSALVVGQVTERADPPSDALHRLGAARVSRRWRSGPHAVSDDHLADALQAAVGGDDAGFAVLWRTLQPAVLRYLRVVCGDAAEDVASETWLQAARDLSRCPFHASGTASVEPPSIPAQRAPLRPPAPAGLEESTMVMPVVRHAAAPPDRLGGPDAAPMRKGWLRGSRK